MPLWVRVQNGKVTDCWDTQPPEDQDGWQEAVEQREPLPGPRYVYGPHRFDLEQTPVAIVWPVVEFPVADRKGSMAASARDAFRRTVEEQARLEVHPDPGVEYDPQAVEQARDLLARRLAAIDAAQDHDTLDGIE